MVKVVVALVASAGVTPPSSTTHLSKTLPVSGASAVTVLGDIVGDGGACNGGRALDDRDSVPGGSGILHKPCLAAVGALAGVENAFALTLRCRAAAVPVVAELIKDMTVAENLSAVACALVVAAVACGGASGLSLIDQLVVIGNFVEGRGRDALLRDSVALGAILVTGIALLGTGCRSYIPQRKGDRYA